MKGRRLFTGWMRGLVFACGGAAVGLAYYGLVGCEGGCAIASNPLASMGYMALVGWLLSAATGGKREE